MENIVYEVSKTTHWKNLFPKKNQLLGSHNLNPGEEIVLTINNATSGVIKDKNGNEEKVATLEFVDAPSMVLNITNARMVASLYGDDYNTWHGKNIQLYSIEITAFGRTGGALRIRPKIPADGVNVDEYVKSLRGCKNIDELAKCFGSIPIHLKKKLEKIKDQLKGELTNESA